MWHSRRGWGCARLCAYALLPVGPQARKGTGRISVRSANSGLHFCDTASLPVRHEPLVTELVQELACTTSSAWETMLRTGWLPCLKKDFAELRTMQQGRGRSSLR